MPHTPVVRTTLSLLAASLALLLAAEPGGAQNSASGKPASPVGDWRGMSICQVKPSGCHDEDSLYHIKAGAKAGAFELQADKIVEGKAVTMGTGPCSYDAAGQLVCPIAESGATLIFQVRGNAMDGVMKMRNGTIWRKLTLKRVQG